VSGTSFVSNPDTQWSCHFDRHFVTATIIDQNNLVCFIPFFIHAADVFLRICKDELFCTQQITSVLVLDLMVKKGASINRTNS